MSCENIKSPNEQKEQLGTSARETAREECPTPAAFEDANMVENVTNLLGTVGGAEFDRGVLRDMAAEITKLIDTSPGTLQDVTMDNSYGVGYRSPCVSLQQYQGNTSPAVQGRSVREFEEQMANLRKENFNLKLRLYFIEESTPGYQQVNTPEGQETLMKQLIDAKVEIEILRKEVQEKQEILKEAAQAMNQMEKIQKDTEGKYQEIIEELQQKIQYMEMERAVEKSPSNNELMNDLMGRLDISESVNTTQKIRELEGLLKQAEVKLVDVQGRMTKLDEILAQRDETIKEYEDKVKELAFQNAELLESIETKDKELANAEALRDELKERKAELADKVCIIDELQDKLKNLEVMYHKARQTIEKLMYSLKQKVDENGRLMSKNNSTQNAAKNSSKDIEKDMTAASECSGFCGSETYKELIAEQRDTISHLRVELEKSQAEMERSEKRRLEWADVCSVLTKRLEELADFLNSLLNHKDVLDGLAADHRRAMRKAIDRSLDLSKSLNMSGISVNDQSLTQLSNLSGWLDEVECLQNLTFNTYETMEAQPMIETLKAENKALKKELDKRRYAEAKKEKRSLPLTWPTNKSESEAWSEPDRKVSMARIGLVGERTTVKDVSINKQRLGSDSENDNSHSGRLNSRIIRARNQERIQQLEQALAQRDERILEIQCQLFDADLLVKQETRRAQEVTEKLTSDIEELKQRYEKGYEKANNEYQKKLQEAQKEYNDLIERRMNEQKKMYEETLQRDWISLKLYDEVKRQLDKLKVEHTEAQNTIDFLKENEEELKQSLVESELSARNLQKKLNEHTLQASKAIMERTKALHDKLELEKRLQELTRLLDDHKTEHNNLVTQIANLEKEHNAVVNSKVRNHNDDGISSQSGYTSEEMATQAKTNCTEGKIVSAAQQRLGAERLQNSSPDLGIESDAGRISSAEVANTQCSMPKTIESETDKASAVMGDEEFPEDNEGAKEVKSPPATQTLELVNLSHDCTKVEQENGELRRQLIRTKRALEDTYEKLRLANQRKAHLEKYIKNQIVKTHNVLKNVRSNMEKEL
ncbi:phosphodiesterase 4D interacting protein centrosomin isoform 1-T1 [Glossina fuscipes fuscipes]